MSTEKKSVIKVYGDEVITPPDADQLIETFKDKVKETDSLLEWDFTNVKDQLKMCFGSFSYELVNSEGKVLKKGDNNQPNDNYDLNSSNDQCNYEVNMNVVLTDINGLKVSAEVFTKVVDRLNKNHTPAKIIQNHYTVDIEVDRCDVSKTVQLKTLGQDEGKELLDKNGERIIFIDGENSINLEESLLQSSTDTDTILPVQLKRCAAYSLVIGHEEEPLENPLWKNWNAPTVHATKDNIIFVKDDFTEKDCQVKTYQIFCEEEPVPDIDPRASHKIQDIAFNGAIDVNAEQSCQVRIDYTIPGYDTPKGTQWSEYFTVSAGKHTLLQHVEEEPTLTDEDQKAQRGGSSNVMIIVIVFFAVIVLIVGGTIFYKKKLNPPQHSADTLQRVRSKFS